MLPCAERVC